MIERYSKNYKLKELGGCNRSGKIRAVVDVVTYCVCFCSLCWGVSMAWLFVWFLGAGLAGLYWRCAASAYGALHRMMFLRDVPYYFCTPPSCYFVTPPQLQRRCSSESHFACLVVALTCCWVEKRFNVRLSNFENIS